MSTENSAIPSIPAIDFGTENADHLSTLKQAVEVIAGVRGEEARADLVSNTMLQTESVTTDKIAANAISSDKLSTGAPTWDSSGNVTVSGKLTASGAVVANGGVQSTTGSFSGTLSANGGIAASAKILKEDTKGNGGKLLLEKSDTSTLASDVSIQISGTILEFNEDSGAQRGAKIDLAKCSGKIGTTLIHSDNYKDFPPPQLSTATGDAPSYAARAWVNFDGTTGTIRSSGNVGLVTLTATGQYTISFITNMPDTNYTACGGGRRAADVGGEVSPQIGFSNFAVDTIRMGSQDNDTNSYQNSTTLTAVFFR